MPAARASLPQLRLLPLSLLLLQRSRVLGLLAPLRLVLSIPVLNLRRRLAHGAPAAASTALLITILAVAPLAFQLLLLERLGIFHLLTPLRLLFTAPTERITPLLRRRRLTPTLQISRRRRLRLTTPSSSLLLLLLLKLRGVLQLPYTVDVGRSLRMVVPHHP